MANTQRLKEQWRPFAEAALPTGELRRRRATDVAIDGDGGINPDAIRGALPWQRVDFFLPGIVAAGSWLGGQFDLPQGARLTRLSARARIAPSTGPFTAHLTVDEAFVENVSIPQGAWANVSGLAVTVDPEGVVRLNVIAPGGAEDVTVSVFYTPGT